MSGPWDEAMDQAIAAAEEVRHLTSPNPWVGCVVVTDDGAAYKGATSPPGGLHAERHALVAAASAARGATLVTTLEPCNHQGRTGPCALEIFDAGVRRVVVGTADPDPQVSGAGIAWLRSVGLEVIVGVRQEEVQEQLAAYLHHRLTGRAFTVAKIAATLDGRSAAPDGTSQWITSPQARRDGHRLRAISDAVIVGAGTVRADDPRLTVRDWTPTAGAVWSDGTRPSDVVQPRRVVVGGVSPDAAMHPCLQWSGPLDALLERLGAEGVVQALVEGGPTLLGAMQRRGLLNRIVIYAAPSVFGGDDGAPLMAGAGAATMSALTRGTIVDVTRIGPDVRIELDLTSAGD